MRRLSQYLWLILIISIIFYSCTLKQQIQIEKEPLTINKVAVKPAAFNPKKGEKVKISYFLSKKAYVTIKVFDPDCGLINTIVDNKLENKGINKHYWDGKDMDGNVVPNQAYFFTIEAKDKAGNIVVYDPTIFSGGDEEDIVDINIDEEAGTVSFRLPKPAWVLGRVGIKGGPLLKTLIDWEPRPAGENIIFWDGYDESKVVKVTDLPGYSMMITTMAFSENSVIIFGNKDIDYLTYKTQIAKGREKKEKRLRKIQENTSISKHYKLSRVFDHAPKFSVSILGEEGRKNNIPIIGDQCLVRVELLKNKEFITGQRFEIAFYLDYQLYAEEEEGYTPYNWRWDTSGIPSGRHVLTVNVVTLGDRVGAQSLIFIRK